MVTRAAEVTMATANSAQREPSMEEILASIRRIIEDSDPGRKQADQAAEPEQDTQPAPVEKAETEVETFRAELRAVPDDGKPFTLAEVQARIAAERSPAQAASVEREDAPAVQQATMTLAEIGAQLSAGSHEGEERSPSHAASAREAVVADWQRPAPSAGQTSVATVETQGRHEPHFDVEPDVEISEDELAERLSTEASPSFADADTPSPGTEPGARLALVSEQTGRQVAAAFEELSEAFANRSKKTFDEMAEEMLRPMLQDWLDNNLPTLVERLVREEIERVARGA